MQEQYLMQMQSMMVAYYPTNNVTTDHMQQGMRVTPQIKEAGRSKRKITKLAKAKSYENRDVLDNSDDEIIGKRFANLKRRYLGKKKK